MKFNYRLIFIAGHHDHQAGEDRRGTAAGLLLGGVDDPEGDGITSAVAAWGHA